ncbi:MAG: bacillithiol system redox-active protein YtxJ [Bacteroidota bacterium]
MDWIDLSTPKQIQDIQEKSSAVPCLIYKHSTTCSISMMARMRLERAWAFEKEEVLPYFLNVLDYRSLSDAVSDTFHIEHESPQILLIRDGSCVHQASHFDIDLKAVQAVLAS